MVEDAPGRYVTFPGPAGEQPDLMRAAYGENFERLVELEAEYDPGNPFPDGTVSLPVTTE